MKIRRTSRGARLVQGGAVLSEVLREPGPTHSVFDVLAAAIVAVGRGPRLGVLGFAGGGIVAPLRAMGCRWPIVACDRDLTGTRLFRELSAAWAGEVRVHGEDAVRWLGRQRRQFDVLVEDLSELGTDGETKPVVSVTALPSRMARRLAPGGLAVINLLPVPGVSWRNLIAQATAPYATTRMILLDAFENRILLAGAELPTSREIAVRLRDRLAALDSHMQGGFHVAGTPRSRRR